MEHTPTPWRIDDEGNICANDGADFRWVAEPRGRSKANAAFIVKACNAHDGLVKALRAVDGMFERSRMSDLHTENQLMFDDEYETWDIVKARLAELGD